MFYVTKLKNLPLINLIFGGMVVNNLENSVWKVSQFIMMSHEVFEILKASSREKCDFLVTS